MRVNNHFSGFTFACGPRVALECCFESVSRRVARRALSCRVMSCLSPVTRASRIVSQCSSRVVSLCSALLYYNCTVLLTVRSTRCSVHCTCRTSARLGRPTNNGECTFYSILLER